MRYLLMVSHGTLAPGLHSVVKMLGSDLPNVLSCSLEDGMGADEFLVRLANVMEPIAPEDEVVLMGDIIGGSPLTNALNTLAERGMLEHSIVLGGMNLPMAMTALMGLGTMDLAVLKDMMLQEARGGINDIVINTAAAEDDEDDI